MDSATVSVLRRPELVTDAASQKPEARKLTVKAIYLLSEAGRKASLLDGGDGRAEQILDIDVPTNRLHLVSVDANGNARLKLRPRFDVKPDGHVVRIDTPPVYDRPPSIDELFLAAAKNHELERAYVAQGGRRARRREGQRELREQLAQAFLASPEQRAMVHPTPSPKRCYLMTTQGRVFFDADRDEGPARDVPAEAHRRFRADERARRERNVAERARRLAVHEEKKKFVADWIAVHGTRDQQERDAAGMLPMNEAIESIADEAFAALSEWPRYVRNGPEVFQAHLRRHPKYASAAVTELDLAVSDSDATDASAHEWARAQEARRLVPDATVTLRMHRLSWRRDPQAPPLTMRGLLVTRAVGPLVLRREFSVSQ